MAALNFPSSPTLDQTYTANGLTWRWDGVSWVTQDTANELTIAIGTVAPTSPANGNMWWKTDEGRLKIYYADGDSSQWVDAYPALAGPNQISTATLSGITGLLKGASGYAAQAVAGTDYVAPGGALGTPSSGTLTNCTGLPKGSITGLGTNVSTALGNATNGASGVVTLDANQNASIAGTLVMGSSFLRNRLINGGMQLDQRNSGASTAIADDTYCFDRWYALTQTASVNISQQTNQENGTPFNIRLTQNQASAQRMGLAQIIESVNCVDLRGQAVTLNMRLRASNSQAIRYAILEWTGTADSVTSDVVNSWTSSTYTAGNFFIATTTTVTAVGAITPSANTWTSLSVPLSGTLGSSVNNLIVFVWTEGTAAQNFTLDIGNSQLERGGVATPFERRQYGQEFALCQRYWQKLGGTVANDIVFGGYNLAGGGGYTTFPLPVQMRASPTVSIAGTWSVTNCGQPLVSAQSPSTLSIYAVVTATGAFLLGTTGTSTYITASIEL